MQPSRRHKVIRFSVFEVDIDGRELRKNGVKMRIQDQPFQILCLLLEQPGEIVTREEIQRRLWTEDTFVDFEQGLNSAVKKLREVLGDSADAPRFLETIPRRGYRFLPNVEIEPQQDPEKEISAPPEPAAVQPEPVDKSGAIRKKVVIWSAAALVCITAAVWFFISRSNTRSAPTGPVPLVSLPGLKSFPSLSPSSQQVAFAWNGGSGTAFNLYEKEVGEEQVLRLTNTPDVYDGDPVWSPDGRQIAFARQSNTQPGIYIVSALGGPERKVLATHWKRGTFTWGRLDWSPDGRFIVFSDRKNDGDPDSLFLLSLDTMAVRRLTSPSYQFGDLSPRFSSDGKSIAFIRDMTGADLIFLIPTDGGAQQLVTSDNTFKDGIAWSQDGGSLLFGGIGATFLSRINIRDGHITRLGFGLDSARPCIRGSRVVYAQSWESYTVVSASLDPSDRDTTKSLLASTRYDSGPQYSPDGKRITFESSRNGSFQIWVANTDGTGARQLTHMAGTWTGTPRWSPDGRSIVYDSRAKGDADIYVVEAEGGPPRAITTDPSNDAVPSWSSDGRSIYFASDRTGRWELFKVPATGGTAIQITHDGGFAAFEAPDGKTVYYAKGLTQPGLWQASPNGGKESAVLPMPDAGYWGFWAPVGNGIYYLDTSGSPEVRFFDLTTKTSRHVLDLRDPAAQSPGMAIAPDQKTLLYTQIGQIQNEIDLVENFH